MNNKNNSDEWKLIDAKNEILGRLASKISIILMGKNKSTYLPNKVNGDYVIVINSKEIKFTGNKLENKLYYKHSGRPGSLKVKNLKTMLNTNPNYILKNAVKGMLPKNKLSKILLKRLKIYQEHIHPHNAQKPKFIENIQNDRQ